jgi:hypothetical protein
MSLSHSPSIVTDGLILALDAANRKSYIGAAPASLINTDSWTVSSGSVAGYGQNGGTAENTRLFDTDPWGNQSIVWGTYASGDGNADGGWNTDYPTINPTKLYRFSVWVRRTSTTGAGTFYFGTGAGGAEVMGTSDSATKGNPYWECTGTGNLTQNQWYLVCGHVYPHFTTYTGRHPNTGYFTVAGGTTKVMDVNGCNIGSDLKWNSASSSAVHRTYHYYCGDATTRLQFMAPRIDLCDGNEPSISELLTNGNSVWKDVSGSGASVNAVNTPAFTKLAGVNCFRLSATGQKFTGTLLSSPQPSTSATIEIWVYPEAEVQGDDRGCMFWLGGGQTLYMSWNKSALKLSNYWYGHPNEGYHESGAAVPRNAWCCFVAVWDYSTSTMHQYTNGVKTSVSGVSGTAATGSSIQIGQEGATRQFAGGISHIKIYNRALSQTEVSQNFNATRRKYGI